MGSISVDPHALRAAAQQLDAAADLLDGAMSGHLVALRLDGGTLRAGLDQLAADLAAWGRAARDTAVALRTGAERYVQDEAHAVGVLR